MGKANNRLAMLFLLFLLFCLIVQTVVAQENQGDSGSEGATDTSSTTGTSGTQGSSDSTSTSGSTGSAGSQGASGTQGSGGSQQFQVDIGGRNVNVNIVDAQQGDQRIYEPRNPGDITIWRFHDNLFFVDAGRNYLNDFMPSHAMGVGGESYHDRRPQNTFLGGYNEMSPALQNIVDSTGIVSGRDSWSVVVVNKDSPYITPQRLVDHELAHGELNTNPDVFQRAREMFSQLSVQDRQAIWQQWASYGATQSQMGAPGADSVSRAWGGLGYDIAIHEWFAYTFGSKDYPSSRNGVMTPAGVAQSNVGFGQQMFGSTGQGSSGQQPYGGVSSGQSPFTWGSGQGFAQQPYGSIGSGLGQATGGFSQGYGQPSSGASGFGQSVFGGSGVSFGQQGYGGYSYSGGSAAPFTGQSGQGISPIDPWGQSGPGLVTMPVGSTIWPSGTGASIGSGAATGSGTASPFNPVVNPVYPKQQRPAAPPFYGDVVLVEKCSVVPVCDSILGCLGLAKKMIVCQLYAVPKKVVQPTVPPTPVCSGSSCCSTGSCCPSGSC